MNLERLYFLREESEMTQEELGRIIGVKKYSISNWERGKEIIPLEKLNAISNYYNVSLDYILSLSKDKRIVNKNELDKVQIGLKLKKIRIMNNLTQRELAKILHTTHSVIWSYETGRNMILTAFAYDFCKKFNVSLDWLCSKTVSDDSYIDIMTKN